jgi:hypothetical protein
MIRGEKMNGNNNHTALIPSEDIVKEAGIELVQSLQEKVSLSYI